MPSPELDPEQSREDILVFAHAGAILITAGILISLWGKWSTFLQVLLSSVVLAVANVAVDGWFTRRNTRPMAEAARVTVNALGFMVNGHITGWLHLIWFYVPFNLLWYSAADRWVRVRLGAFLAVVTAFALWDGADLNVALTEPFREYVDDVLPATLDGIRRVNAIVGDLRRFARGDSW